MTLDEFIAGAVADCVEGRPWPDDIGMCDLCGSETGMRRRARVDGVPAWVCVECIEAAA